MCLGVGKQKRCTISFWQQLVCFRIFGLKVFHLFYNKTFANKNYSLPPLELRPPLIGGNWYPDILNWWSGKLASSFVSSIHNTSTEAFDNTSGWRWVGPVRRAGSPRWDDFHPTFICNLLPQFNQSVCYIAGKGLFDKVVFSINSDVKPSCRTNVLILFN